MSILIRGMEMPETCKLCYLSEFDPHFYAYVCKPTGVRIDYEMAKIDRPRRTCPLIHVSDHGRLIDADKLKGIVSSAKHMDAGIYDGKTLYSDHLIVGADYDDVCAAIDETPTVISAEEEDEAK